MGDEPIEFLSYNILKGGLDHRITASNYFANLSDSVICPMKIAFSSSNSISGNDQYYVNENNPKETGCCRARIDDK